MKILFLTHRLPYPPLGGAKVRAFHTIEHLGRRHEVTVVAPARSRAEAEAGDALRDHCRELITEVIVHPYGLLRAAACLPTATPSSMGYFHSRELRRRLRRSLAATRFDLIMVHSSSVAPAVAEVAGPAKILDFVDMDSQKWLDYAGYKSFPLALGYRIEGHKLARAEARLANAFDLRTCATAREVETLAGLGKASPAEVVPNGVDLNYFAPTDAPYRPDSICFVGRMDYFPNQQCMIDFCAQALPLIRQARPGVTLTIVGAAPRRAVRRLAEIPGVTVTRHGRGREAVRAGFRAHRRASEDRQGHPEQGPRVDGHGRAGGGQHAGRRRRRRGPGRTPPGGRRHARPGRGDRRPAGRSRTPTRLRAGRPRAGRGAAQLAGLHGQVRCPHRAHLRARPRGYGLV